MYRILFALVELAAAGVFLLPLFPSIRKIYRTQPYADFLFHPIRLLFRRSSGIGRLSEHPRPQPGCHAASRPPCRHPCRFPKCLSKCAAVRSSGLFLPLLWDSCQSLRRTLLFALCVTLFIELSQLFTLRATDINDILTNLAGAAIGYFLAKHAAKVLPAAASPNGKEPILLCTITAAVFFFAQPFVSAFFWELLL